MNKKSQNRLAILNHYVDRWLSLPRMSRQRLGDEVVQTFYALGFDDALAKLGIHFNQTDDIAKDLRPRSQKIFRWLGHYDEVKSSPDRLFYVEAVIVAAMPEQVRLAYLNEVYSCAGVFIGVQHDDGGIAGEKMAAALVKENAEAQISVMELGPTPDAQALSRAKKELRESIGTSIASLRKLEERGQKSLSRPTSKGVRPRPSPLTTAEIRL